MPDVKVVAPFNVGKGIIWNDSTKKYEVNIGDGLEINSDGKIVIKKIIANTAVERMTDNGTGAVVGEKYTIDYGNGLIEVNGIITYPLATKPNADEITPDRSVNGFSIGCAKTPVEYIGETMYHKESTRIVTAKELGMSNILSVQLTACDLAGYRTETPWVINDALWGADVTLGVRTLATLEQDQIRIMYQIKGLKA